MSRMVSILASVLGLAGAVPAQVAAPRPAPANHELLDRMNVAWAAAVSNAYSPATSLFYSTPAADVPGAGRFRNRDPNLHGGGTGAEDCSMFGGILLAAMCDRFEATRDPGVAEKARMVFRGLKLAATVHGQPGFIARGVCAEDGTSIYPGSSRDQFTHSIHGMWRFFHSAMSDDGEKQAIREILCAVADKMTREVTFENGYAFKFAYGIDDDRGVARMRNVRTHEAARLPMFYAAAWDVGRKDGHRRLWREYLPPAIHQSLDFATTPEAELKRWVPAYSVLQMQASLELLLAVETEPAMVAAIRRAMKQVAEVAESSPLFALQSRAARDRAEIMLGQMMSPDYTLSPKQAGYLAESIVTLRPERDFSSAYALEGAYWRARKLGWLAP